METTAAKGKMDDWTLDRLSRIDAGSGQTEALMDEALKKALVKIRTEESQRQIEEFGEQQPATKPKKSTKKTSLRLISQPSHLSRPPKVA